MPSRIPSNQTVKAFDFLEHPFDSVTSASLFMCFLGSIIATVLFLAKRYIEVMRRLRPQGAGQDLKAIFDAEPSASACSTAISYGSSSDTPVGTPHPSACFTNQCGLPSPTRARAPVLNYRTGRIYTIQEEIASDAEVEHITQTVLRSENAKYVKMGAVKEGRIAQRRNGMNTDECAELRAALTTG